MCREKGSVVEIDECDVTDDRAVREWFERIDNVQPVDILFINAGVFDGNGPDGQLESADEAKRIIATNLMGAIFCSQAGMRPMMARRQGRIVLVSSLAAWLPLPDAPTYSSTKAGLAAYGAALREFLLEHGVDVTIVLPGHVRTTQTEIHIGPTPLIIEPERAARFIAEGIAQGKTLIAFPPTAKWLTRIAASLPWRMQALIGSSSRFHCRKEQREADLNSP